MKSTLTWREATRLLLEDEGRELPIADRLALQVHMKIFIACQRFVSQINFMLGATRAWRKHGEMDATNPRVVERRSTLQSVPQRPSHIRFGLAKEGDSGSAPVTQPLRKPTLACLENDVGRDAEVAGDCQFEQLSERTIRDRLPPVLAEKPSVRHEQQAKVQRADAESQETESENDESQPQARKHMSLEQRVHHH
jgi:hypothetical protein